MVKANLCCHLDHLDQSSFTYGIKIGTNYQIQFITYCDKNQLWQSKQALNHSPKYYTGDPDMIIVFRFLVTIVPADYNSHYEQSMSLY